jgi:hypothetical protein
MRSSWSCDVGTEGFDRWLMIAEAQLDAARRVDPAALAMATDARRQLQEELSRTNVNALSAEQRAHAAGIARRIRSIDLRIHACGTHVTAAIEAVSPTSGPKTYGRRGQLRGV